MCVYFVKLKAKQSKCMNNYGFIFRKLSLAQLQGVITFIPKPGKPKHQLKNMKPISLLNIIQKIIAATIASRIEKIIHIIINEDQNGR